MCFFQPEVPQIEIPTVPTPPPTPPPNPSPTGLQTQDSLQGVPGSPNFTGLSQLRIPIQKVNIP